MKTVSPFAAVIFSIFILLLTASPIVQAADIKAMLYEALKEGSFEGLADDKTAKVFNIRTLSSEPLHLSIKRIRKFKGDCAEFRFHFEQTGIKNPQNNEIILDPVTKKPALLDIQFNFPVCMDGSTPQEAMDEEKERRANIMNVCMIKLVKGKKTKDTQEAAFIFNGCPARGHVELIYEGTCKPIEQAPNTFVRFDFDKKGHAEVGLRIPMMCTTQPPASSKWTMHIFENINMYESQVGTVYKLWE